MVETRKGSVYDYVRFLLQSFSNNWHITAFIDITDKQFTLSIKSSGFVCRYLCSI